MKEPKIYDVPRSFRLDRTTVDLLQKLSENMGVSKVDVVRLSVRALAKERGVGVDVTSPATAPEQT